MRSSSEGTIEARSPSGIYTIAQKRPWGTGIYLKTGIFVKNPLPLRRQEALKIL
jgi:hypothetical protein